MLNYLKVKFSKSYFVLGLLIVLFVSSCSKESDNQNFEQTYILKRDSRSQPLLTSVQIDSIGIMHNELLEQFLNELNPDSLLNNSKGELERVASKIAFMDLSVEYRLDMYRFIRDSSVVVDQVVLNYYNKLKVILNNNLTVSSVNNSIDDLCDLIELDNDLSLQNKQQVLVLCSIAKHSKYFWASKCIGGSGVGEKFLISYHVNRSSKAWQNIVISDTFGGLTGGIGWCIPAVLGGPVGVAGFIGNIIYGAASASLVTWATGI